MYNLHYALEKVKVYLGNHSKDYEKCVQELQKIRDDVFSSLHILNNPVLNSLTALSSGQLKFIIQEYSSFSNEAIHMLLDSLIRDHDWQELKNELWRNIQEEMGAETKDVPHLEIMRQGYRKDLSIETDNVKVSFVTRSFLYNMRKIFKHDDNAYSAGALLAFEGTAIQEFHIVEKIVQKYRKELPDGSLTNYYIRGHKDFEIGHEKGLRDAIEPYITDNNIHKFVRGYLAVCMTMSTWWEQLEVESVRKETNKVLSIKDVEIFDLESILTGKNH
jgi:hypothetical protein